ncbi:MAG: hypothetical protein GYA12_01785 [Chloroflexi bacterium]|nr:hypothetical protein [Chloroflexota bacterium]
MEKNIIVIAGSPAARQSNSESLANYMAGRLTERSCAVTPLSLRAAMPSPQGLLEQVKNADVLVLSVPLYENSLPGLVVAFFEMLLEHRAELSGKSRDLFVIGNSGFAEPRELDSLLEHCRLFAREMGFRWIGGLAVSPGTLIDGKKLEETGGTYKKVMATLDTAADMISRGEDVSEYLGRQPARPLIAPFMYRLVGRLIQNSTIKKLGKAAYFARPLI